jgi:hypothetical protein
MKQPILLITSSDETEKSVATKFGSFFSLHLFRILSQMNHKISSRKPIPLTSNRNLQRLIGNIASRIRQMRTGYSQTVSIYSSYVIHPILWMWIGSNKSYDIVSDLSLNVIIIRYHPEFTSHSKKKKSKDVTPQKYINPYDSIYNDFSDFSH